LIDRLILFNANFSSISACHGTEEFESKSFVKIFICSGSAIHTQLVDIL